jgi:putative transcriptional regulator
VRYSNKQPKRPAGYVDRAVLDATTEADITRQQTEDEAEGEFDLENARVVAAPEYVSSIRKKLGLTQRAFAERFQLKLRTVEEWEQGRAAPDQATLVLLRVIDHDAKAVERALNQPSGAGKVVSSKIGRSQVRRKKASPVKKRS